MTSPDLSALLLRVRGATGGDRELDGLTYGWARGYTPAGSFWCPDSFQFVHPTKRHPGGPAALYVPYDDVPEYTCSVDAALELVAEKLPEWTWSVGNLRNGGQAYLMRAKGAQLIGGPAATPALALIAAMLEALIGRIEDE